MGSSDAAIRAHGDALGRIDGWGGNRAADHATAAIDRRAEGLHDAQADHGAHERHSEVPEARRRREEGRDRPEAQDGGRAEGLDHPEAHDDAQADHGAQERHSEVPEARGGGEEGRDRAEAQDGGRSEGLDHPEANRFAEDRVPQNSLGERGASGELSADPAESAEEAALHDRTRAGVLVR
jgi:hypothetical protein